MRHLIFLFSFLLCSAKLFSQNELLSGLYFSSHEVIQDKRTSLNLTPDNTLKFKGGIILEMEAKFRQGDGYYGYIFRMIGDKSTNIDLVSNLASTASNFWLVLKDNIVSSYKWADIPNGKFDQWIKIRLEIDIRNSKIAIWINGKKQEAMVPVIRGLTSYRLVFGASEYSPFYNTDVCPMTLRNIRILDTKNNLLHEWKLSKHSNSKVYDEVDHAVALVKNPNWLIDKHLQWGKYKDLKFNNLLGITYDELNGRLFFVDHRAVYILSTSSSHLDTIPFAGGLPYFELGNQIIYNKFTDELWSYNFNYNEISKFNFNTHKWSQNNPAARLPDFWHHNKFISPADSSLVTMFGYGHYKYKSIINTYNPKSKSWEITDRSSQIQPRYLGGLGALNNQEMLVFGGYGSNSGQQEISPQFYYTLYSFNLKNFSFKKLWSLDEPSSPFVPCEALIPDQESGYFYTLLYNRSNFATFLHLARFGIEKNEYQLFNDSIPYSFLDTESWSTLFLDQKTSHLIAVTSHNSAVAVYTIAYPPLMPAEVYQSAPAERKTLLWLIRFILAAAVVFVLFMVFRKKIVKSSKDVVAKPGEHPSIAPIEPFLRKTVSSIYLMGGFQIYDRHGQNITGNFSPTLKHLFLFIFLHTLRHDDGVSSSKLDEVLWFDKSDESARNNRNVNISKLRSILEEVEGLDLVKEGSLWKIKIEDTIFCDYTEIMGLLQNSKSGSLTESEIHQMISLLAYGEFLPDIQNEWMDEFKSLFSNVIIDVISSLFIQKEIRDNYILKYHLAECILTFDQFNDEAFAIKCSSLYHLGKKGIAKNLYDTFCKDYKKALGIDFDVSFSQIIQ